MKTLKKLVLLLLLQSICLMVKAQHQMDNIQLSTNGIYAKYGLNEKEWKALRKIWKKQSIPVRISLDNGKTITGQVISLDEKHLSLWTDNKSFIDPGNPDLLRLICLDTVSKAEMLHLPFFKKAIFWLPITMGAGGVIFVSIAGEGWIPGAFGLIGIPAGILPGYLIDRLDKRKIKLILNHEFNPELTKKARDRYIFYPGVAPDFLSPSKFNDKGENPQTWDMPFDSLLIGANYANRILREPKLSFSVRVGYGATRFYDKRTHTDIYSAAVRYKISGNYLAGFMFKYYKGNNTSSSQLIDFPGLSKFSDFEGIKTKRYSLNLDYMVRTPGKFTRNRLEGLIGASLSLNALKYSDQRITYTTDNYIRLSGTENVRFITGGLGLEMEGSWYFSNKTSFFINAEKNFVLPVRIKPGALVHPVTGVEIDSFSAKQFSPSSFDITLGIAFHF